MQCKHCTTAPLHPLYHCTASTCDANPRGAVHQNGALGFFFQPPAYGSDVSVCRELPNYKQHCPCQMRAHSYHHQPHFLCGSPSAARGATPTWPLYRWLARRGCSNVAGWGQATQPKPRVPDRTLRGKSMFEHLSIAELQRRNAKRQANALFRPSLFPDNADIKRLGAYDAASRFTPRGHVLQRVKPPKDPPEVAPSASALDRACVRPLPLS